MLILQLAQPHAADYQPASQSKLIFVDNHGPRSPHFSRYTGRTCGTVRFRPALHKRAKCAKHKQYPTLNSRITLCPIHYSYDDMVDHITVVATSVDDELTVEERNLLAVAYKNVIGSRRASWRAISHLETNTKSDDDPAAARDIKAYRLKIERELELLCTDMLAIIDKHLLSKSSSGEGRVFYYKMKGDYHRYLAEFRFNEERAESARNALEAYKEASVIAVKKLAPTNPIRLGLALNFSVFYCDILNSLEQACGLAKRAFDGAIAELDTLTEDSYRDSTMIMQLLRRNLTLWTTEEGEKLQGKPKN